MSRNHDHEGSVKTDVVIQVAKQAGHLLAFGYNQLFCSTSRMSGP
jgi:hypothetical protein